MIAATDSQLNTRRCRELLLELLVGSQQRSQLYERPHHMDAHQDGASGVENVGCLDGAVLGEGMGQEL